MSAQTKLNVAVIGVGYWGKNLIRLANDSPLTNLVGLCDMHAPTLAKAAAAYPDVPAFASVDALLAAVPSLEAVIVVVPAVYHHAVGLQCLRAGKHVFIEKPLAISVAECDDLTAAAAAAGVRLFVDHTFLFNSSLHKMIDIVNKGEQEIGTPLYVHCKRTNLGPFRTDVSALWDLASHDISMVLSIVPHLSPSWVSCTGSKLLPTSPVHDVVFLTIGFKESPFVAHIHASWMDPSKEREMVLVCSKARVVFNDIETMHPIKVLMKGPAENEPQEAGFAAHILASRGDVLMPHFERKEPLAAALADFVKYVREPTYASPSDGVFGGKVVAVLQAADRSLAALGANEQL